MSNEETIKGLYKWLSQSECKIMVSALENCREALIRHMRDNYPGNKEKLDVSFILGQCDAIDGVIQDLQGSSNEDVKDMLERYNVINQ